MYGNHRNQRAKNYTNNLCHSPDKAKLKPGKPLATTQSSKPRKAINNNIQAIQSSASRVNIYKTMNLHWLYSTSQSKVESKLGKLAGG